MSMALMGGTTWQKRGGAPSRLGRTVADGTSIDRTVASLLVLLILVYTVFAMVQGLVSFSLNRVAGGAIILVLAFDFLRHLTGPKIVAACLVGIIVLWGIGINTTSLSDEVEFWIYWGCTMLFLCHVARPGALDGLAEACCRYKVPMSVVAGLSACLILLLLVTHTGYTRSWEGSYFAGLCNTNHTMGSVCCIIMAMALLCSRTGSLTTPAVYLICAVTFFGLLQTGARTFLIPALIIGLLVVKWTISWPWLRVIVVGLLAIAAVYVFATSGMADKFDYVSGANSQNAASSFSSGRVDYWSTDLGAFFSTGAVNQLIGNSASFVYDLNQRTFSMRIWSHDDFVMSLCTTGWCGLILYLAALKGFFGYLRGRLRKGHYMLLLIYVLFPAVINGFYGYQHLLYSTVLLVCAFVSLDSQSSGHSANTDLIMPQNIGSGVA